MKIINTENAPAPIGPYTQAVMANGTLYVSGQIPLNPDSGELITGSIEEETRQVMENLKAILEAAGTTFSSVAKCSIFLKNMENFPRINQVYGEYFSKNPPARETVEVSGLPMGTNIEISCIAIP